MFGVSPCFEHFVEAGDAAAVFGRAVAFAGYEAGACGIEIAGALVADG